MKTTPLLNLLVCLLPIFGSPAAAWADQMLVNGDFETEPLNASSATNTFPGWAEGSNGSTVTTNATTITGNHSALITKFSGGSLNQNITNSLGWNSDWIFDTDFACSNPGGGAARSFQLNLYHTATANISLRVIDVEPDGTGDVQIFNGSAFVTVMSNAVNFSTSPTNLNVNHLKITGHYYATNTPNYDVTVISASAQTNSIFSQTNWQISAPPANTNTHLIQVRFDTANVVAGTFEVVDNISIVVPVVAPTPVTITSQPTPASAAVFSGYNGPVTFSGQVAGTPPFSYQWQFNNNAIVGATNSSLILSNLTATNAGNYNFVVTNSAGSAISSNAVLSFLSVLNTPQMTNIWNLLPGAQPFLTTGSTERGLVFNSASTNLLLATRYQTPTNNIAVLNPATGAFKYFMDMTGVPVDVAGTTLGVNMVAVSTDGVVYGGSVTANAGSASTPYQLWQWSNDNSNTAPLNIFAGDPGFSTAAANLRWGDNLCVRGSGPTTQILIAPGTGTNVALFTTPNGTDFFPSILAISNVPSGFAKTGLAFGSTSNTFWAKTGGGNLSLVQFDLNTASGAAINIFSNNVAAPLRSIGIDATGRWLAGIASGIPDNVQLYNISNLTNGPTLVDQELFATGNANNNIAGGVGSSTFGGNYLFTLDQNNGIKAFLIDTNYVAVTAFSITDIQYSPATGVALTWQSNPGSVYQVQSRISLQNPGWTNLGGAVTASGTSTSATNAASGATGFYRVQTQ